MRNELLTPREAAKELRISLRSLYRLTEHHKITFIRTGSGGNKNRMIRFKTKDIQNFLIGNEETSSYELLTALHGKVDTLLVSKGGVKQDEYLQELR